MQRVHALLRVPQSDAFTHYWVFYQQAGARTDLGRLLHVQPLAVVLQQEFVAAGRVLERDAVHRARPVDAHARGSLCMRA